MSWIVRMVRGIASESGQLFKDVLACEVEMQKDADLAEKEGLMIPGCVCEFITY